ncbi:MAG TPA: response regulator, partial [Actinomycetota bacterium]|nr:response regulator [Actinomycetota bacterium]
MRILVVEDDPAISLPLRKTLEREGYQVCVCDEGRPALDFVQSWVPDVVLLDVQLPDMNGHDIARAVRNFSSVPIIMVTGRGEIEDKVGGLDAGAND